MKNEFSDDPAEAQARYVEEQTDRFLHLTTSHDNENIVIQPGDVILLNNDKSMPRIVESVREKGIHITHYKSFFPWNEVTFYARP